MPSVKEKKIEHIWSVFCQSSLIDSESNSISLMNVIEQLEIEKIPQVETRDSSDTAKKNSEQKGLVQVDAQLVSFWQRLDDKDIGDLKVGVILELEDPAKKVLRSRTLEMEFKKGFKGLRFRAAIKAVDFTIPGEYSFRLKIKEGNRLKEVARIPLSILLRA